MKRTIGILTVAVLLSACAPWAPAPVEDRGRPAGEDDRPAPAPRIAEPVPAFYEVRRGDTLYSIAFRFGKDWREVARWNRIEPPYTIRPGLELRLTEPPTRTPATIARPAPEQPESEPERPRPASAPVPEPRPEPEPEEPPTPSPAEQARAPAPDASGNTRAVGGVDWQWPASGRVLRPFDASATRRGIGIAGSRGQPVYAAAAGEVVYSGTALIGYGELIIIKHSDTLLSAYGHNRVRLVEEGDRIARGQQIAEMGLNDRNEEILHFEIRRNGQPVDPTSYLPSR